MSDKKRVLSGIRATGRLHLGNYLGAVKGMLALQADPAYETFYMVADAHAVTTPYQVDELRQSRRAVILDYLACGLDPEKSVIFQQAEVSAHFELAFYFSSVTTIAKMQHLPTFKDKVKQYPEHSTMALLNYPVLMAADILVYMAELVPVGLDQEPHLEVTREIARRMNQEYGTHFPEPQRFATTGEYVPSLAGEGKMSKSVEGSFIQLTDSLDQIKKALAGAPTDSGKGAQVPTTGGVANLLKFVELFQGLDQRREYEAAYTGAGLRYGDLKAGLAEAIFKELEPIQARRRELEANPKLVDEIIASGVQKAQKVAEQTVQETRVKMGLG
jgi:tryptophanyl-tRNA synthetase